MTDRAIDEVIKPQRVIDDGDMRLFRALPLDARESVGPFVFVDHYRHQSKRGIGDKPHPHAGIEVLSYLLEGGVEHRDSMGYRDTLGPGDAQWIAAGRGMIHAEVPSGGRHGLQLWTSLPPDLKGMKPEYRSIRAGDIPVSTHDGVSLRTIAGKVNGQSGPFQTYSGAVLARVTLEPNARIRLAIDPGEEIGVYSISGKPRVAGQELEPGELAVLGRGDAVLLSASTASEALVLGGPKIDYPLVFDGPFVMDSEERIAAAYRDFRSGAMGKL